MPREKRVRQKERAQAARAAQAAAAARARRRRNIVLTVVVVVGVFVFAWVYSTVRGGDDGADVTAEGTTPTTIERGEAVEPECPPEDRGDERRTHFTEAPPDCLADDTTYEAVFETDAGDIRVALDTETAPGATNNFVFLARWGYYDDTAMFRTDTSIDIIQGGAPHTQDNSDPGPGYTIEDEGLPFTYSPGDLVFANTGSPNSSSAQYFFGAGPGVSGLDAQGSYITFGEVIEGLDVLESILERHSGPDPGNGAPSPMPIVSTVRIIER